MAYFLIFFEGCFADFWILFMIIHDYSGVRGLFFLMLSQDLLQMLEKMPGSPAFGYEASVDAEKGICFVSHLELPDHIQAETQP